MITLQLSEEEREELLKLIETSFSDTKIEVRRTRNPEWREKLQQREELLASLVSRLKEEVPVS
ncbi:MAG: hypothetical protein NTZ09_14310 [Candidatus Hydrogenedentes bacterium]|nr:hypothetical protein [Candidatus Hydrogenedentota bacterium]